MIVSPAGFDLVTKIRVFPMKNQSNWLVFGIVIVLALSWAAATSHVWEDYYITYRSSKNLATGQGLVFTPGERLHTFTSPLGVLLPAAASLLTGNKSDTGAIWIFRVWSAAAYAGAALFLLALARRYQYGFLAGSALVLFAVLDAKSIDFTINGMETGFLLLFIAYALWAMFGEVRRRWLHLGLAWGALMWTRPDSFLYIGLLAAGVFLFNDPERTGLKRGEWLRLFFQAGAVCTIVYLPWFTWAWWYYGSPVPHTIIAKGNVSGGHKTALGALQTFLNFPLSAWKGGTSLEATFLPSYFQIGGWPEIALQCTRWVALVLAFQWVLPWRVEVRTASFAFCGLHVYLSYFPFFPFPWYLPGTAFLAAVTIGGILAQISDGLGGMLARWPAAVRAARGTLTLVVVALLAGEGWLTWQMMREMKVEQELSATAVRRKVGEWLHANAKPTDTVFMEPLGHIGYFSGLRTYDFPGLSSPEVVRGIRVLQNDWAVLVEYLSPDWLVLRPFEYNRMRAQIWRLFSETYQVAAEFNTLDQVERAEIYGRNYVAHDAHLTVFRRVKPRHYRVDYNDPAVRANFPLPFEDLDSTPAYKLHATGIMSIKVPAGARHVSLTYGLPKGTYTSNVKTDGVEFQVRYVGDDDKPVQLLTRRLNPAEVGQDRGVQHFEADLTSAKNGELVLFCFAGGNDVMDWSSWGIPEFKF